MIGAMRSLVRCWCCLETLFALYLLNWRSRGRALVAPHSRALARTDPLTGLCNPRTYIILLESMFRRTRRQRRDYGIAVLKLVNFETINKQYGHLAGNIAQAVCARYLTRSASEGDTIAHVGARMFALATEGLVTHEQIQTLGVVSIAKSHWQSDHLPQGVTLKFRVVGFLLEGRDIAAENAMKRLMAHLESQPTRNSRRMGILDM